MEIVSVEEEKKRFLPLLLLGDEQESMIDRYLEEGELYVLRDEGRTLAVCVVARPEPETAEIKNLAVDPRFQRRGLGRRMVDFVREAYAPSCRTLLVGTGDSPLTIPFYRACGFREAYRVPNFFTDHYDHPIFEGGRQLVDMVYLQLELPRRDRPDAAGAQKRPAEGRPRRAGAARGEAAADPYRWNGLNGVTGTKEEKERRTMTKKEKLHALRNDPSVHYNCAQSMLIPFAGETGITQEQANALALNFGGGMGCGSTCGALTGTLMAMGGLGLPQEKREEIIAKFRAEHGCLDCDGLLQGIERRTPEQKKRCDAIIDGCMDWLCRETGIQ